ncbi:hypothetical protein CcI156_19335 [Frankia sp. CcI156]|jgi:hypothetical protein|uniref:hypothetical protein n=1 Tax=Frankia TaxID=1854 RepID=UPI0002F202E8|nr:MULTISPECIES: hypothetical protein [Frankia]ETA00599.1 hypothetical protein CcI6DRAFT_03989 [Frankia sp. CcI6]EYT91871.1 hypothetical protein ThrDRAFT_02516 [Frankia casuarinae]KDA41309.1 hypothetical protein BMG523Draft_03852 [Frankia sp. BMG5.23]KEZ34850.1 hypothetical protein CEDDRAFT_03780 [Frankia sp. CeD]KFB03109.1 hypothetical protein ALLO2DRAFT_04148 [Frankia sp. Allo2]
MAIIMRLPDGSIESIATTHGGADGSHLRCELITVRPGDERYEELNARLAGRPRRAKKAHGVLRRIIRVVRPGRRA